MTLNNQIREVCSEIEKLVTENKSSFIESKDFKVKSEKLQGKYYLDRVSGSYKQSLQNLIHKILWFEDIYKQLIDDDKELLVVEDVINNYPDEVYKPDSWNAENQSEQNILKLEKLEDTINEIHFKSIIFTRKLLENFSFFDQYYFDREDYKHPMLANLSTIRSYTKQNKELSECHHFLYDLPFNETFLPDVIVLGINPGESLEDFELTKDIKIDGIFEESQESDFHKSYGKGRSKSIWKRKCEKYTGTKNIICSEVFFWSSPHPNEKSPPNRAPFCFSQRFGYKFRESPHFEFCTELNKDLIHFYKPKYILMTGVGYHEFVADLFNLEFIEMKTTEYRNKANKKITYKSIIKYMLGDIPFIFTQHISGAQIPEVVNNEIISYLHNLLIEN